MPFLRGSVIPSNPLWMSKQVLCTLMFAHYGVRALDEQPGFPFALPDGGNTHRNWRSAANRKRHIKENGCQPFCLCDAYMIHWPHVCGPSPKLLIRIHEFEKSIGAVHHFDNIASVHGYLRVIDQLENRLPVAFGISIEEKPCSILDGGRLAPGRSTKQEGSECK